MRTGKIILVDDNEAILHTLKTLLSREFSSVVVASNPTLLPALLAKEDVDVVLLDMNFDAGERSGREGLFWLNHVRERKDPPPVILITAYGDVELAVSALKKGAADFIVKPWDNDRLIEKVVTAWELRHHQRHTSEREQMAARLLSYFLNKYASMYGKPLLVLDPATSELLTHALWNGRIEWVEQTIETAILLDKEPAQVILSAEPVADQPEKPSLTLEEMEKQFIQRILQEKGGNLSLAAQQLDISRQTLYNKMKKYDLR